jgi:hypothetical protein
MAPSFSALTVLAAWPSGPLARGPAETRPFELELLHSSVVLPVHCNPQHTGTLKSKRSWRKVLRRFEHW